MIIQVNQQTSQSVLKKKLSGFNVYFKWMAYHEIDFYSIEILHY